MGNLELAAKCYLNATHLDPRNLTLQSHKADLYPQLGMHKKATDTYDTFSLLERETDTVVFQELMVKFQEYWRNKEPSFVNYFLHYYANRPGKCKKSNIVTSSMQPLA